MAKRMAWMITALVIIFGGLVAYNLVRSYFIKQYFASFEPPPVTISTATAKSQIWRPFATAVGTLSAQNGVVLSAEVQGLVAEIYFQSGQLIHKGDLLIKLRDDVDVSDLKNAEANLQLAKIDFDRQKDLLDKDATSRSLVDNAKAKYQQAQAALDHATAVLAQKHITAPFDGKIGIRQINLGEYVSAGQQLVSLQALDPLFLGFDLPEQQLKQLQVGQAVELQIEAHPNQDFSGKITAINSTVDPKTHTIAVQATIPNQQGILYPGLFANVKIIMPQQQRVVTVPQTAVSYSLYGDTVFVVEPKGKDKTGKPILIAKKVYITSGDQRGAEVAILKGLTSGQQVVISGQLKLQNDTRVIINNNVDLSQTEI